MDNYIRSKSNRENWRGQIGIEKAVLTLPVWSNEWSTPMTQDLKMHNGLHLWRIDIHAFIRNWKKYFPILLTEKELKRAHSIKMPELSLKFLASRGALRCLLAEYLKADPRSLEFSKNRWGKPTLNTIPTIHFNLAHSSKWIILGISFQRPLGVDLERVNPAFDYRTMVSQYFHPAEQQILDSKYTYQIKQFFELWTRKEALAKAMGMGLHERLLATNMLEDTIPKSQPGHSGGFFAIHSFEVDHENTGALALRNFIQEPKFLHFPES